MDFRTPVEHAAIALPFPDFGDVPRPAARVEHARRGRAGVLHPDASAFQRDRAAECWDAGQPRRVGDTVSGRIDQFSPKHLDPERWERIGPLAREWVAAAEPATPSTARAWMNAVTQLLAFCDTQGWALTPQIAFQPRALEYFIAKGCAHLSSGTQANYRSQLRTVGERVLGPEACPNRTVAIRASDPAAPYSASEVSALLSWANGLTTPHLRHNAKALLVVGLGAGLTSQEFNTLVGTDIEVDDDGVAIHVAGPGGRVVPVLRRWEDPITTLAEQSGARPVFRSAREQVNRKDITRFLQGCRASDAPRLSVQRLRITWIVHHLSVGTPVPALLGAAGIAAKQLARYYPFVPSFNEREARRLLRGPVDR